MSARYTGAGGDGLLASCVIAAVAAHYGIPEAAITGRCQTGGVVRARHVAMYLCVDMGAGNLAQVGQRFGGRTGQSVGMASRKVRRDLTFRSERTLVEGLRLVAQRLLVGSERPVLP